MEDLRTYKSFTDLETWKAARDYKKSLYALVSCFPKTEQYRLEDQLIRSARSICSNIAEGYGRFTYKDQLHFCIQARGSLYETVNHIVDAYDCTYISEQDSEQHKKQAHNVEKILNGYISWLKKMAAETMTRPEK